MSTLEAKSHLLRSVLPLPAWMQDHSISFSDIQLWLKCHKSYAKARAKFFKKGTSVREVEGELVHEAVTKTTSEEVEKVIAEKLAIIPQEKRAESEKAVRKYISMAVKLRTPGVIEQWKERKLKYLLKEIGWELVSKPDEINLVKLPSGETYLEIVEYKTGKFIGGSAKDQLIFGGLVAALIIAKTGNWTGDIQLVARCLATGEQKTWTFYRSDIERYVAELAAIIKDIEVAMATQQFNYQFSKACHNKPCRFDCRRFKEWVKAGEPETVTPLRPRSWRWYTDPKAPKMRSSERPTQAAA